MGNSLGYSTLYLNAAEQLVPFYETLGWRVVERDYGWKKLYIVRRS
jgi:hypothetical protein